jgi:hypothetical protein
MLGGRAAVLYISDWSFCDAVRLLRQLPSLASLENEFWEYLAKLKVRGTVRALTEGSRVEYPTRRGDKFGDGDDEDQFSMPLVELTDVASVVAYRSVEELQRSRARRTTGFDVVLKKSPTLREAGSRRMARIANSVRIRTQSNCLCHRPPGLANSYKFPHNHRQIETAGVYQQAY